jgi:transposase
MPRPPKSPLRRLTGTERREFTTLRRSRSAPAAEVTRATLLLLVSDGHSFQAAARFNTEGLAAVRPRHGGGQPRAYGPAAERRILREAKRTPTPEADGTATWSLSTLRRALRAAPDGLPRVSTYTIWRVLHAAGYTFQRDRTWCPTGRVARLRKAGVVTVTDPDTGPKKS